MSFTRLNIYCFALKSSFFDLFAKKIMWRSIWVI